MTRKTAQTLFDSDIKFYISPELYFDLYVHKLTVVLEDDKIIECRLSGECNSASFNIIDNNALFNFSSAIRIPQLKAPFKDSCKIEIEIFLRPDQLLLLNLSQNEVDVNEIKPRFLEQSKEFQSIILEVSNLDGSYDFLKILYPFLFTENWFLLSAWQYLPTGRIGYKTLWSHFYSLDGSVEKSSQEQISDSISDFIHDLASIGIDSQNQKLTPESLKETAALLRELASQTTDITSPEIIISQSLIFDVMISFFREEGWPFTKLENQTVLRLAFEGKHGKWNCYAQAIEREQQFVFYSVCSFQIPRQKLNAISEFINRANYGMVIGNFELDYSDGEIRYKTSIDVEGSTLDSALIKQLVYTNVMTMDEYLPGILAVLEQNIDPTAAIQMVEATSDEP